MNNTETQSPGSIDRCVRRPEIGEMVIVHNYTPKSFKARVRDYYQCASNCIRVTRAHTTEEWIVMWQHCSPNVRISDGANVE